MNKIIEKAKIKAKSALGLAVWALAFLLLVSIIKNVGRVANINNAVEEEKQKVEKMEEENAQLEDQIAQTQGPEFIDKEIRDKLGLVKTGEAIVVLPDEATLKALAPQMPAEEDTLPDPIWKKWFNLFTP